MIFTSASKRFKKNIYKALALGSLLLDPLYSFFLFKAVCNVGDYSRDEFKITNNLWNTIFFIFSAITSLLMSTAADVLQINPIEEAEAFVDSDVEENLSIQLNRINQTNLGRSVVKVLINLNQSVANIVYLVNSTSSAISVSYLISSRALRFAASVPIVMLNLAYNNMLTRTKVNEHTFSFLESILTQKKNLIRMISNQPLESLEVAMQILTRAFYSGVSTSYIVDQILSGFFENSKGNRNFFMNIFVLYIAIFSCYLSIFSRSLNVKRKFFKLEKLSNDNLRSGTVNVWK